MASLVAQFQEMTKASRIIFVLVMAVSLSHFIQKPFRDYAITVIGVQKLNWLLTGIFAMGIVIVFLFYFFRNNLRSWMPWVLFINGVLLLTLFVLHQQSKEYLIIYCLLTGSINLSLMSANTGLAIQLLSVKNGESQASFMYMAQTIATILGPFFCMFIPIAQTSWVLMVASIFSFLSAFLFNFIPTKTYSNEASLKIATSLKFSLYPIVAHTFLYTLVSILFYYLLLDAISSHFATQNRMMAFSFAELGGNILGLGAFWLIQNSDPLKSTKLWMLPFFSVVILIGVAFSQILSLSIALLIFFKVIKNGVRSMDRDISLLTIAPSTFVPTKNMLDTIVYRSGDMAGGWIVHWLKGSVNSILIACGLITLLWLAHSIQMTRSKYIH